MACFEFSNYHTEECTLDQSLRVYESKKRDRKKVLGNYAPNSVLLIAHVTTPHVDLPLCAFPPYLQIREAIDFALAVYFTVCYILHAIKF